MKTEFDGVCLDDARGGSINCEGEPSVELYFFEVSMKSLHLKGKLIG